MIVRKDALGHKLKNKTPVTRMNAWMKRSIKIVMYYIWFPSSKTIETKMGTNKKRSVWSFLATW